jgi:hypothetical protein
MAHDAPSNCLRGTFFATGEEPLEIFGAFLLIPLRTSLKESFADLGNATPLLSSDTLEVLLES